MVSRVFPSGFLGFFPVFSAGFLSSFLGFFQVVFVGVVVDRFLFGFMGLKAEILVFRGGKIGLI